MASSSREPQQDRLPYVAALGLNDIPGALQARTHILALQECVQGLPTTTPQARERFVIFDALHFVSIDCILQRSPSASSTTDSPSPPSSSLSAFTILSAIDSLAAGDEDETAASDLAPYDLVICLLPTHLADQQLPADFQERLNHRRSTNSTLMFAVFGNWGECSEEPTPTNENSEEQQHQQQHLRHWHHRPHSTAHASRYFFQPQRPTAPPNEVEQWWSSTFRYRTWFDSPVVQRADYLMALSEALRCHQLDREQAYFLRAGAAIATHLVHAFHVCQTVRMRHARKQQESKWKLTTGKDDFVKGILHFFFHEGKPCKEWPKPTTSSKSASMFSSAAGTASAFTGPLLSPHNPSPFNHRFDVRSICFRSAANVGRGLWLYGDEDPAPRLYHHNHHHQPAMDTAQLAALLTTGVPEAAATRQYYLDDALVRTSEPLSTIRAIGSVHNTRDDQRGVFVQVFVPNMLPVAFLPDLFEWFLKNLPSFERFGADSHLRQVLGQVLDFNRFQVISEMAPSGDQCRVVIRGRLNKAQLARQHPLCSEMLDKLVSANIEVTDADDRFKVLSIHFERGGDQLELEFYVDPNTSELLGTHFLSESSAPTPAAASSTPSTPARFPKFTCPVGESLHVHFSLSVSFLGFDWNLPSIVLNVERTPAGDVGVDSSLLTVTIAQIKVTNAIKKLLGLIGFSDLLDDLLRKTCISILINADLFITAQVELPRSRIFAAAMSGRAQRYYERIDDLFSVGVRIGQALIDDMIKADRTAASS